jgi:hypothetical protein
MVKNRYRERGFLTSLSGTMIKMKREDLARMM